MDGNSRQNKKMIYVIIPVHNRCDMTCCCLNSLRGQSYQNFSTILINDGSTDGTCDIIKEKFPEVVILTGDGNLWWTGAANLGVEYALKYGSSVDYILTLNNDTTVPHNYLETLLGSASQNPKSLIGSLCIQNGDKIIDAGVRINLLTAKYTKLKSGYSYEDVIAIEPSLHPTDFLSGRGTLIPVEVFKNVGLYNRAKLPHYGSDYEFSYRARKNGYNLFVEYKAVVMSIENSISTSDGKQLMGWHRFGTTFFSIKSPLCIFYRWNFAKLVCPRVLLPTFFLFDIGRTALGVLRNKYK